MLGDGSGYAGHYLPSAQYGAAYPPQPAPGVPVVDLDSETDSNHDTALTLACAGGHEELVTLLLSRGADIEHRDKKGFTPLILAATAGHDKASVTLFIGICLDFVDLHRLLRSCSTMGLTLRPNLKGLRTR